MSYKIIVLIMPLIMLLGSCQHSSNEIKGSDKASQGLRMDLGKTVEYFDMVDLDGNDYNLSSLTSKRYALIIIFPVPCAICSQNMQLWRRVLKSACHDIQKFGVVIDDPLQALNLADKKLDLQVVLPHDAGKFRQRFILAGNEARTILLKNSEIIFLHTGELTPAIFTKLMRTIKKLKNQ